MKSSRDGKTTNVLVIGSGGREHALAWKALQSKRVEKLYVAPGNGGTAGHNVSISATDVMKLREFAKENSCFTIVGPEAPLAAGIVDEFRSAEIPIFGPTSEQARLETSKVYAKEFMRTHGIPTADFKVFDNSNDALDYVERKNGQVVVKADGLAAGKGVVVCSTVEEADLAIRSILEHKVFGKAGERVVIEEKLTGREASYMLLCDGKTALDFGTAVDHKRALDGDMGPNTGGMGAYSPAFELSSEDLSSLKEKVIEPVIKFSGFRGFLYLGLMFDDRNFPRVLEFNARLGDPEAQAILPRLETDLFEFLQDCEQEGYFQEADILKWSPNCTCTVVMCSEGYPKNPKTGDKIKGLPDAERLNNLVVFHSGTILRECSYYSNGGRVLSVTGLGGSPIEAAKKAYEGVSLISWLGERHRTDISSIT